MVPFSVVLAAFLVAIVVISVPGLPGGYGVLELILLHLAPKVFRRRPRVRPRRSDFSYPVLRPARSWHDCLGRAHEIYSGAQEARTSEKSKRIAFPRNSSSR